MKLSSWNTSVSELPSFEMEVRTFLKELNIDAGNLKIDHLGMKFDSQEAVDAVVESLKEEGAIEISSVIMKGRVFRNFKLGTPIIFLNQEISFIELPDAKLNISRKRNGFEHLEFYFDEDIFTLEAIIERFNTQFPGYRGEYNTNLPNVEGQLANPTIEFEDKARELEVKFHAKHIKDIINSESIKFD